MQRSPWLRRHAGQPAFPGGAVDESDGGPVAAALREAAEEAQVDPAGVQVLAVLPELFISRSGFSVTPVLAWWRRPGPVGPGDPMEVTAVARVRVAELADPANRMTIRYPSGQAGPAFRAGGMLVWGFTAMLVDRLLALGGWELPWDSGRSRTCRPRCCRRPGPTRALDLRQVAGLCAAFPPPRPYTVGHVPGDLLDLILIVLVVAFAVAGYRQGFIIGVLSFAGFIGGGALGAEFGPRIAPCHLDSGWQAVVAIVVVFLAAVVGQLIASGLGVAMRSRLTWRPATVLDSVGGAVVSVISVLLIAWLIGSAVAYAPFPTISRQVNDSAVLRTWTG